MKKAKWFILIGLALLASIAFMGCKDDGVTPTPPVVPIPPTFEETITGKFWLVDKLEKYSVTQRSAGGNPYELDVCMYFGANGEVSFWEDANDDGLLSPSEQVNGIVDWYIDGETMVIDGNVWDIAYFNTGGWAIEADITGTTLGEWFGNEGEPYEGWIRIHYVPCLLGFDDGVITASFAFVFDDMGDVLVDYKWIQICKWGFWKRVLVDDEVDGFYFTFGENHILIVNTLDGGAILSYSDGEPEEIMDFIPTALFKPNHVYDMTIVVDSADVVTYTFVSRVDGSGFSVSGNLDHSLLGEIVIRGINDADVPVVNP